MNRKLLHAPLALCALFGTALAGCSSQNEGLSSSARYNDSSESLKEEYDYGDVITVPDYELEVEGGVFVNASGTVIYPDGAATRAKTVTLNQYGYYTVRYYAYSNGKEASHDEHFYVREDLFSVGDIDNSFVIQDEIPDYAQKYTSTSGVYVGLAKGDTLTIKQPIPVSALTSANKLVSGFITPKVQSDFDFSQITIRLTDSADSDNYVKFQLSSYSTYDSVWGGIAYWQAGANGQVMCGYDYDTNKVNTYSYFGTKVTIPFNARTHDGAAYSHRNVDPSNYQFTVAFDDESKGAYCSNLLVADLDSATYFSSFFEGFKGDSVQMSITCSTYTDTIARFCLTSVYGVDLTQDKVIDDAAPEISVDTDYDVMPEGGVNTAYPIPSASAHDAESGDVSVSTEVYYNYNSDSPILIQSEGLRFTPTRNGYYAIVYTAKDIYNNTATKVLWVHVGVEINQISARISTDLADTCKVGETIEVPELTNLSGGTGRLSVTVTAAKNGETIDITDGKFQPLSTGDWSIKYSVTDYIGNTKNLGKVLTVTDNDKPVLAEVVSTPASYMSGASYDLPSVYAYIFDGGVASKVMCDVEVNDASGTATYSGGKFTPTVTENNTPITINYSYRGTKLYTSTANVIMSYVDGKLKMTNYFLGTGFDISTSNEGIVIENKAVTSNWTFAKPVIASNFSLTVGNYEDKSNYSDLKVTITDSVDSSKAVTMEVDRSAANAYLKLNKKSYGFDFDFSGSETMIFGFNGTKLTVGTVEYSINYFDNGEEFTGFPSDLVNVSMTVRGSGSGYVVSQLNKNVMGASGADRSEPEFCITDTYGGKFATGSTYRLPRVVYNDVLSPCVSGLLTVTAPDGSAVKDTEGNELKNIAPDTDMYFVLEQYGSYTVSYTFDDKSDLTTRVNTKTYSYKVNSADTVAPVITVTSGWSETANVGDTIVMPDFTVSDNVTAESDIKVIKSVVSPNGYEQLLASSCNSIVTKYAGTYIFKITAIDGDGNSAFLTFACVVK